jgi:hypothetical protein
MIIKLSFCRRANQDGAPALLKKHFGNVFLIEVF